MIGFGTCACSEATGVQRGNAALGVPGRCARRCKTLLWKHWFPVRAAQRRGSTLTSWEPLNAQNHRERGCALAVVVFEVLVRRA